MTYVVKRAYLLPNILNFNVFATENLAYLSEKSNISNTFKQDEFVRSCNFLMRKRKPKGALT